MTPLKNTKKILFFFYFISLTYALGITFQTQTHAAKMAPMATPASSGSADSRLERQPGVDYLTENNSGNNFRLASAEPPYTLTYRAKTYLPLLLTTTILLFLALLAIGYMLLSNRRLNRINDDLTVSGNKLEQSLNNKNSELSDKDLRLNNVMNSLLDALITINAKGIIQSCNKTTGIMFGYDENELIGKNISLLMTDDDKNSHDKHINRYIETGNNNIIGIGRRTIAKRRNGSTFPIDLGISELKIDSGILFTGIIRDISDQVRVETQFNKNKLLTALLQDGLERFIKNDDFHYTSDFLLTGLLSISSSNYGFIGQIEHNQNNTPYLKLHSAINKNHDITAHSSNLLDTNTTILETLTTAAITHNDITVINIPGNHTNKISGLPYQPVINNCICIPIKNGHRVTGLYFLANSEHGYNETTTSLLRPFNSTYATIIEARKIEKQKIETINALEKSTRDAINANTAKSQFLSSMSHELRTPLHAIMGFTQILEFDAQQTNAQNTLDYTQEIMRASDHLLTIINDILDLSRIESGKLNISQISVDLTVEINECYSLLSNMAKKNQITLKNTLPADEKIFAYVDPIRIKQILINLITNAIKYNKPGGDVTISYNSISDNRIQLLISDSGHGIAKEHHEDIFQSFTRLGREQTNIEGTGVGLNVTRSLVQAMNGEITINSKIGEGSTFTIEFDKKCNTLPHVTIDQDKKHINNTILICTSDPSNLDHLKQLMSDTPDIQLVACTKLETITQLVADNPVDIVLIDLDCQSASPANIMSELLTSATTINCPIAAISRHHLGKDIQSIRDAGFDLFFHKPISDNSFTNIIKQLPNKGIAA